MTDPAKPWSLIRSGRRALYFETADKAREFYDRFRTNGNAREHATLYGPGGVVEHCPRWRHAEWRPGPPPRSLVEEQML